MYKKNIICSFRSKIFTNFKTAQQNICSVGLESECPGMEKIKGKLFIPEGELFIPRSTVVWLSVARPDSRSRNGKFDRGMESKPDIFFIPGPFTFQPYRYIFSICGASTNHKTSSNSRCYLWMSPNLDVVYGCPRQPPVHLVNYILLTFFVALA